MKKIKYISHLIILSFLFFSCRKPVDVIEEAILIDELMLEEELAPITSIVIGDTIGEVGFAYYVHNNIDFTSCYYGNPNGGGVGIDFDGDSISDICFFSYNEGWSDMGYVENFSGSGMENMNDDLVFLTDSLGLAIVGNQFSDPPILYQLELATARVSRSKTLSPKYLRFNL